MACIAAFSPLAQADQPVHCVKSQVAGFWTFEVSREAVKADIGSADSICTHELPNKLQITSPDLEFTLPGHTSELYLSLNADYSVDVLDADKGKRTGERGTWSVIYDQAMIVDLPDRKAKYTANFRYSLKDGVYEDQFDKLICGSYEAFDSRCDETMVGVKFNESDKMVQCWVGYQTANISPVKVESAPKDLSSPFVLAQTSSSSDTVADVDADVTAKGKLIPTYRDMSEEERIALSQTINEANLGWTADPYLAEPTKGHSFAQTASESYSHKTFGEGAEFAEALRVAQKWLKTPRDQLRTEDMDETWNWENVNGFNFVGQHVDQGKCGSCYLLASNTMLESRLKVWYGVDIPLSAQHRLDCNFVNEGCHGGWGYLDGLFLENFGAVAETCAPYIASTDPAGCALYNDCPKVASVKNTQYLGGHYGGMSEAQMIKELRSRGPILLDFNAGQPFQAYKNGVLKDNQFYNKLESDLYAQTYSGPTDVIHETQEEQGFQWVKLTHSTVLLGYGVAEDGTKYWTVRNSYGPKWGESGNFRIRRGQNDFGCEGENITFDPVLYSQ